MHPNPVFRSEDRALFETLIDQIGFGMIFLTTPDGPRVAHTPLLSTGDGAVQFHLSRGNALTRYLDASTALVTVNGPDGYVSPRWYDDRNTVPTWDYIALEMEGRVRRMEEEGLEALLHSLIERSEGRISGDPWRAQEASEGLWQSQLRGIIGFEMEILAWRPTLKMSQKRTARERETIARGLEQSGSTALAHLMRTLA
ncbi:FMN-binding negative transcriptional regulator [Qipengyuania sp.]|uniref:FMN-binding negative transcriptional regulator n=1 Tax=Qipengyuania sp. TaxID=2004515 RepID=UPI0035C82069